MAHSLSDAFLKALPKAELHLHIEGTLEPELMFELAKRNQIDLPYGSIEAIRSAYSFSNLQDFLDIYYQGAQVLLKEADFYDLAMAYFKRASEDGIRYVEFFFDPQTHTERGVAFSTVITGFHRAQEDALKLYNIHSGMILCILRHLSQDAALETLKAALPYRSWILGIGLDSSEMGHPPSKFTQAFEWAKAQGWHVVAHAGEEGPPAYIYEALDILGIERIDHGNRCLEDQALTQRIIAKGLCLTVCPLSNLKLCVVKTMDQHPLDQMLALGLKVTINSDDPAYFGGYLVENFKALIAAHKLDLNGAITCARHSFEGAFLSKAQKATYLQELDHFIANHRL